MRRFLDWLYRGSGWLAAVCLVAIATVVLAQIVGRFVNIVVPDAAQMAGFFMCATIFLALAFTLAAGEQIRVSVIIEHVGERTRWWMEFWVVASRAAIAGYFSFFASQMAWESFVLDDRADGLLAIPYVIPQSAMAVGAIILFIRLIDETFYLIRTGKPLHLSARQEATSKERPEAVHHSDPPALSEDADASSRPTPEE